ncbi:hypothetical protein LJC27_04130, partial [Christensenellaceae bacterium OttesenSCG-928-M15]|nr:hypothetical protein [Christensenellaceae bacterium OttesenSCG-928-M15]
FVNVLELEGFSIVDIIDNHILHEISKVEADVIVVTPLIQAESIAEELSKYTEINIIVLEDLL